MGTDGQASGPAPLDVLTEALPCIVGEGRQLGLVHENDGDAVPRGLGRQRCLKLPLGCEQRNRVLLRVRPACLEQPPCLESGRLRVARRHERRAQDETACRIHERDAVEIAVLLRADGRIVELEDNPRLVGFELTGFQHGSSPWAQAPENQRRAQAIISAYTVIMREPRPREAPQEPA